MPPTIWAHEFADHTDGAKKELRDVFGTQSSLDFFTPKPTRLIERILQIATNPGDLILDSFAGSGTTGHAVLKMNAAETARTESTEATEEEPELLPSVTSETSVRTQPASVTSESSVRTQPASVTSESSVRAQPASETSETSVRAQPASVTSETSVRAQPASVTSESSVRAQPASVTSESSVRNPARRFILVEMEPNIASGITAERVKRVAEGYTNAKGDAVPGLGGGFRYCQLGEPLFDEAGQIRPTVKFGELARHVWFTVSPSATASSGVGKAGESDGDERPESRTRRRAERGGAGGCTEQRRGRRGVQGFRI